MPSASARAETQTSPPAASTSSARARSPTRCAVARARSSRETPRLGRSATVSGPTEPADAPRRRRAPPRPRASRTDERLGRVLRGASRGRAEAPAPRHARVAGKRVDECAEPLARGELLDDRREGVSVLGPYGRRERRPAGRHRSAQASRTLTFADPGIDTEPPEHSTPQPQTPPGALPCPFLRPYRARRHRW